MAAIGTRRSELAQLVANHIFSDENRYMLATVVDRDRVPDHLGEDRGGTRPGTHIFATLTRPFMASIFFIKRIGCEEAS